jgi:AraC-like DNA-binding protein
MSGTQGGGFTVLYRRVWSHGVFRRRQEAAVFVWMISEAQWQATTQRTNFGPIALRRGELLIQERAVAEEFGMHRNTLRALIQRMSDEGMIELNQDRRAHRAGTIVTVTNYEQYQGFEAEFSDTQDRSEGRSETRSGPQEDRKRTAYKDKQGNQGKEGNLPPSPARTREADPWEEPELVATIEEPPPLRVVHDADQPRHAPAPPPASRTPVNGGYGPGWDWQPDARGRDACARHGIDVEWAREKFVAVFQATPPIRPVVLEARFISFVLEEANRERQAGGLRRGGAAARGEAQRQGLARAQAEIGMAVAGDPTARVVIPSLTAQPRRAAR